MAYVPRFPVLFCCSLGTLLASSPCLLAQPGVALTGVGAINRGMGGAATAAPLDADGALYWNPATLTGLPQSEMEFGLEALYPRTQAAAHLPAGALGPGLPAGDLEGATRGESGVFPLPSFGLAYRPEGSDWVVGLGVFAAGGFGANYPADPRNPLFSPHPPLGLAQGAFYTNFQVLQIVPALAYPLEDCLTVGIAPVLDLALLQLDPGLIAPPDDANGDGFPTYPALTHTRYHLGGGVQAGIFYSPTAAWHLGAAVKSPQWFETFRWHTVDELGRPRTEHFRLEYPLITSVGVSYTGWERWLLALDVRWIDYRDAAGFGESGFTPQGALRGVGWRSTWGLALGAQYQCTEKLAVRGGYTWNESPVPADQAAVNVGSAAIAQQGIYVGASYRLSAACLVSIAYVHLFENAVTGPLVTAATGPIPGSRVTDQVTADALLLGLTVQFGGVGVPEPISGAASNSTPGS
jgi:long-chain fatty acid transport protein